MSATKTEFPTLPDPVKREDLEEIYTWARTRVEAHFGWYERHRRPHLIFSYGARIIAFAALGFGSVAPALVIALEKKTEMLAYGYVAAIVGGLVLLLDQSFLWTKSHARYATASRAIKAVWAQIQYDWSLYRIELDKVGEIDQEKVKTIVSYLRDADLKVEQIVQNETSQWSTQLDEALAALSQAITQLRTDTVARQKEIADQLKQVKTEKDSQTAEAAKAKAAKEITKPVNIVLEGSEEAKKSKLKVTIDGKIERETSCDLPTSISLPVVKVGSRVTVLMVVDGSHRRFEQTIEVAATGVNNITLTPG